MSDVIWVGLVGFGYVSKMFYVLLIGGMLGMVLKVVVSSDVDKVYVDWSGVKVMSVLGDLLDDLDIDLVVIVILNDIYFLLVKVVLEVGKYVVVDKFFIVILL